MLYRNLLLAATAFAALSNPVLAQTTSPTPATPAAPIVSPPTSTAPAMSAPGPVTETFYQGSWMPTHWRTSDAIGQPVYNKANEKLGDIEDVLIDGEGRVLAAVIGVGGFLGMGEHKVAVTFKSFQMSRDAAGKAKMTVDFDGSRCGTPPVQANGCDQEALIHDLRSRHRGGSANHSGASR